MCLVVLAWNAVSGQRLVLVGNRDELHARPTAAMGWWRRPRLLAGRDLSAGGTWLGVDGRGRVGVVTNFRGGAPPPPAAPSRGTLIPRYLAGELSPAAFLGALASDADRYAGFSLLVANEHELGYFCNRDAGPPRLLAAGIYGLSNATLDSPWPKLVNSRAALAERLAAPPRAAALLDLLADRAPAADGELPDTGVGLPEERRLSPAFILGTEYGTRSTTALVLGTDGHGAVIERSYAADGSPSGTRRFRLSRRAPPDAG
ncbi:MAG TPA: NRDE family protein [Steroidobacteraceae bacterium]|nr:NRDE family protein [Steroidobacteraceae bacterium]